MMSQNPSSGLIGPFRILNVPFKIRGEITKNLCVDEEKGFIKRVKEKQQGCSSPPPVHDSSASDSRNPGDGMEGGGSGEPTFISVPIDRNLRQPHQFALLPTSPSRPNSEKSRPNRDTLRDPGQGGPMQAKLF